MVFGMATKKITITLESEKLNQIRALVASGTSKSISGFVQHAVGIALSDAAGWSEMLKDALAETGGPLTSKERHWADSILDGTAAKPRPRKKKAA